MCFSIASILGISHSKHFNRLALLVAMVVTMLAVTLISPRSVQAANVTNCVGNNLSVNSTYNLGFGSFRVNGSSGPNLPATLNNAGNVVINGPGCLLSSGME